VSQTFQIHDSSEGGQSSRRRPIVLARIPRVGVEVGAVAESTPIAPAAAPDLQPNLPSQETRLFVDRQHELTAPTEPEFHEQPWSQAEPQPESPSRRHRFHKAHGRRRSAEPSPVDSPRSGKSSKPSSILGEVISNPGLSVILALAASAALLYWLVVVPGRVPIVDYNNNYETFGSAEIKTPEFSSPTTSPVTSSSAAAERHHFPEQGSTPSIEPMPVFDDASAQAYPATRDSRNWNLARKNNRDYSAERATLREMPPTPIPASRQP
jgi:hypothetical protein